MSNTDDNYQPQLSLSTLEVLKEFALYKGMEINSKESSPEDVLESIHSYFSLSKEEQKEIFHIQYANIDDSVKVSFDVEGVRRELGQTLNSTGLTM